MSVLDAKGRPVPLAGEIGVGGEGTVFDIRGKPDSVAKLYLKHPDPAIGEKLKAMVAMGTSRLMALAAWPTATLHRADKAVVGFVMPKLAGHRPVFQVYGPKLRLKQFPRADWRFLVHVAGNVARAFGVLHESGLIVGDVNHGNLFVAENGTVRFIDADSMQVTQGARQWPCEVGVGTHQPPEMQGLSSYRGVVRTPNHDNFGLAVLVFQLLCMGRHPFSGRFAGTGEAPDIEQAITDSRYAYSADTARTRMAPPPGSLPMSALPPDIRALFEAAFAPTAVRGGRPGAEQWATALTTLGATLCQCGVNAAHWFAPVAGACPWCEVEARSGLALFPAVFVAGTTGHGGIVLLWTEIQAVPDPGPLPALARPDAFAVPPSAPAAAAQRRQQRRRAAAAILLLAGAALVFAAVPAASRIVPLLALAAAACALWWWPGTQATTATRQSLIAAQRDWDALQATWRPGPAARFAPTRQSLVDLKREYDNLPGQRDREVRALAGNRRAHQLQAHLEGFEIADARIAGIGKAKVANLLSYGIETAADIEAARVEAVPGFGPRTAANLLAFREQCEASFRFDATRAVASAEVAAVDGMLAQRQAKLESELAAGLAQLRAMATGERRHRAALEANAAALRPAFAQVLADARALGVRS